MHTCIDREGILVGDGCSQIFVHDLGVEALCGILERRKLFRCDGNIDDVSGGRFALPHIELQLLHHLLEFVCVGGPIDSEYFELIVTNGLLIRDRCSGHKS